MSPKLILFTSGTPLWVVADVGGGW